MRPQDIIARKRDGMALDAAEIAAIVGGITDGSLGDAQIGAFAMAVFLNGLSPAERVRLTRAMQHSGETLVWDLPGPVVDKHSTGGVGDNVSLVLAPALAACGAYVPMISGRGLGHTGGTLDKFDAIPGYDTAPARDRFEAAVRETGCAIIGQTDAMAPADRRLYAIRDVTGTVESVDLITASILSKKLAAGLEALVLDVQTGSGAFMRSDAAAAHLAETLVRVANDAGCRTAALVTDMNEPLASAAGNALEVANAIGLLTGTAVDGRLWDVTVALGGELLALAGMEPDTAQCAERIGEALRSGAAAERFAAMVRRLGGPSDLLERHDRYLAQAPVIVDVPCEGAGFVQAIDTRALGVAVADLGGGRRHPTDRIDPAVGLDAIVGIGAHLAPGDPLARVHAADPAAAEACAAAVRAAYVIGAAAPEAAPLVQARIG